jgi:hypothetical protein
MIQGNFLAKKGIWVSEYRIESGLNWWWLHLQQMVIY